MKKLNKKGFTLVELLAVIIILAIVVGITIPAVLTTTSKAKTKAFTTAAQTAADWIDRQYQVFTTGLNNSEIATLDANFSDVHNLMATGATTVCMEADGVTVLSTGTSSDCNIVKPALITASGLSTNNVASMHIKINTNTGRSCVTLTATSSGDYNQAGKDGDKMKMQGGSC